MYFYKYQGGSNQAEIGKSDKVASIPQIKNSKFYTYSKYNLVFGVKRDQVFEVRSFDNSTKEKYKIKLEFVFSKPGKATSDPILNHYFVLDPLSTADDMANDPGIQW